MVKVIARVMVAVVCLQSSPAFAQQAVQVQSNSADLATASQLSTALTTLSDIADGIAVTGTVTVTDGAGALNTIVDSGTLTAVTTITNPVTVTDGAGSLNVIVDSGTITAVTTITNAVTVTDGSGALNVIVDSSGPLTVSDGAGALNVICDSGCSGGTTDTDDGGVAGGQTFGLQGGLGYVWTGSAWARMIGDATDGVTVNLGANNDVTVTGTVTATVTGVATDAKLDTIITHIDAVETIFGTDAIFGTAGTPDADVLSVQFVSGGTAFQVQSNSVDIASESTLGLVVDALDTLLASLATEAHIDDPFKNDGPQLYARGSTATPTAMSADDDAVPLWTDLVGRLHVATENVADVAATNADIGSVMLVVRDDALSALAAEDNDFTYQRVNANGATWVIDVNSTTALSNSDAMLAGVGSHGAATSVEGYRTLGEARKVFGTAVDAGDDVKASFDPYGRSYTTKIASQIASSNATPITATTTSVISAPSMGTHLVINRISYANGSATACRVSTRNGAAGSEANHAVLPQYGAYSVPLDGVYHLSTATRLDIVLSAACSLDYTIYYDTVVD